MFSSDKNKPDTREHLIIGCGHHFPAPRMTCGYSHPKSRFITLDIDPDYSPDITCDAENIVSFNNELSKLGQRLFSAIIFEYVPSNCLDSHLINQYQDYLKHDGNLIVIGAVDYVLKSIFSIKNNECIWISNSDDPILIKSNSNTLLLDSITKKYLGKNVFYKLKITPEILKRISILDELDELSEKKYRSILQSLTRNNCFILDFLFNNPNIYHSSSTRISTLKQIVTTYHPGFFSGCIKQPDIFENLTNYLNSFADVNHTLTQSELINVLALLDDCRYRLQTSNTYFSSSVTTILKKIAYEIVLSYEYLQNNPVLMLDHKETPAKITINQ